MNILVTGIARGLGLEITKALLSEGYDVYGIDLEMERDLIDSLGQKFHYIRFDLAHVERVQDILLQIIPLDVPIHGFVNNAAIAYDDIITNLHLDPLAKMYKVNVFSPMILTKYAIRNMLYHNIHGSIVHISSVCAHTGYKGLAMYASTKGALEAFSLTTAREWGTKGIRSNCVAPGFMETSMSQTLTTEQRNRIYQRTSLKKETEMRSVAQTVLFLIGEKSSSITGTVLHVDNGTI